MNLRDLYQKLDTDQREAFAKRVGIQPGYLWQLATQWRDKKPSLDLLSKLADADRRLSVAEMVQEFTEPVPGKPATDAHAKADDKHRPHKDKPSSS